MRFAAVTELTVAVIALSTPAAVGGTAAALAFLGLTIVVGVGWRRVPSAACGCFGERDGVPYSARHVTVNLLCAIGALIAAVTDAPSLAHVASREPARAALMLVCALLLAGLLEALLRAPGAPVLHIPTVRLVDVSARALEARFSRRSALTRIALTGSAICVAPLRYLLYPVSALAVVVPSDCSGGLCTDGYTAFCCEINQGLNTCPAGTFPGGWWMCTDYRGHQLCEATGVRYYVDCNATSGLAPSRRVPVRKGRLLASARRLQHLPLRPVQHADRGDHGGRVPDGVVRQSELDPALNCSSATMVDNGVCGHEAPCLEPPPIQLQGAGGA